MTVVVGIGGSAGSIDALAAIVADLPADFPACALVTVHISSQSRSALPAILSRAGALPATHARDGDRIAAGRILVAPPNRHLVTDGEHVRLGSGPRVNRHRPSTDVMFASIARCCGPRSIAVVLSGVLDDGAFGAALIAESGGTVLAQSPEQARFGAMPAAALAATPFARSVATAQLAGAVQAAVTKHATLAPTAQPPVGANEGQHILSERNMDMEHSKNPRFLDRHESRLTRLVCPECGGALAEVEVSAARNYRCHVGHEYAPKSLAAAQAETAERKLWAAIAALQEYAALAGELAQEVGPDTAAQYQRAAQRAAEAAEIIREQVPTGSLAAEDDDGEAAEG